MIREAITKELKRQGKTRYSLAKSQDFVHPSTCLAFLYCGRNIGFKTAEAMLKHLRLRLITADELAALKKLAGVAKRSRRRSRGVIKALNTIKGLEVSA